MIVKNLYSESKSNEKYDPMTVGKIFQDGVNEKLFQQMEMKVEKDVPHANQSDWELEATTINPIDEKTKNKEQTRQNEDLMLETQIISGVEKENIIQIEPHNNENDHNLIELSFHKTETFESLDIVGPTRTHFANLEIKESSDNKVIFIGEKMFAKRIKENNISELKKSLDNAGFGNLDIEIEEIDKVIDTPSNNWKKKRKEQIEDFQKEIINSSLIKNLQENYDKTLNKEKLIIIDHEE